MFVDSIGKDHINYKPFRGLKYLPSPRRHLLSSRSPKTLPEEPDTQDLISPTDVVAIEDVSPPPDNSPESVFEEDDEDDDEEEDEEEQEQKKVTKKTKSKSSRGRLLSRIKRKDKSKEEKEPLS